VKVVTERQDLIDSVAADIMEAARTHNKQHAPKGMVMPMQPKDIVHGVATVIADLILTVTEVKDA
jgi:hypothetical protein